MKKIVWIVALPLLVLACKSKKKINPAEDGMTSADLIALFEPLKPPYSIGDTTMGKRKVDTAAISFRNFTSVVPDTLLNHVFGKATKLQCWPLGKIAGKEETYLLVKITGATQKAAYVLVFDKTQKFVCGLPLLVEDNSPATQQTASIDSRNTITINLQRKAADGKTLYKKTTYAFVSSIGAFGVLVTETNEAEAKPVLLNPIDTLPAKNKWSGDYRKNRMNLVSIRDSRKTGEFIFFIHFEEDDGCRGELKGRAKMTAPNKAMFKQTGDQCELYFTFAGNTVSIREDGCGSHRDIKCFFSGTFTRKFSPKTSSKTSKPVKKSK